MRGNRETHRKVRCDRKGERVGFIGSRGASTRDQTTSGSSYEMRRVKRGNRRSSIVRIICDGHGKSWTSLLLVALLGLSV